jgi:hypothetical protein
MNDDNNDTIEADEVQLTEPEPMITVRNVSKDTLRFTLLREGYADPHRACVPDVVRDLTRPMVPCGPLGEMQHPPKLDGSPSMPHKQKVRQTRELPVVLPPGKKFRVPRHFLNALLTVRCELCAGSRANPLGKCTFFDDVEHRASWHVLGPGLVSPTQIEVEGYQADLKLDALAAEELAETQVSTKQNQWGRRLRAGGG